MKKIILIFSIVFLNASMIDVFKQNPMLQIGEATFVDYNNHTYYVSVGISDMKDNSIQSRINSMKIAKSRAISGLNKFINNVRVSSYEKLESFCKRDKKLSCKEEYLEIIKSKAGGFLKNFIDFGKYRDNKTYYYFVGIRIK